MATGNIKSIEGERGFGFITGDATTGNAEFFFHHSAVQHGGFAQLQVGQRVEFSEGHDPRNPDRFRANDVAPLTG